MNLKCFFTFLLIFAFLQEIGASSRQSSPFFNKENKKKYYMFGVTLALPAFYFLHKHFFPSPTLQKNYLKKIFNDFIISKVRSTKFFKYCFTPEGLVYKSYMFIKNHYLPISLITTGSISGVILLKKILKNKTKKKDKIDLSPSKNKNMRNPQNAHEEILLHAQNKIKILKEDVTSDLKNRALLSLNLFSEKEKVQYLLTIFYLERCSNQQISSDAAGTFDNNSFTEPWSEDLKEKIRGYCSAKKTKPVQKEIEKKEYNIVLQILQNRDDRKAFISFLKENTPQNSTIINNFFTFIVFLKAIFKGAFYDKKDIALLTEDQWEEKKAEIINFLSNNQILQKRDVGFYLKVLSHQDSTTRTHIKYINNQYLPSIVKYTTYAFYKKIHSPQKEEIKNASRKKTTLINFDASPFLNKASSFCSDTKNTLLSLLTQIPSCPKRKN